MDIVVLPTVNSVDIVVSTDCQFCGHGFSLDLLFCAPSYLSQTHIFSAGIGVFSAAANCCGVGNLLQSVWDVSFQLLLIVVVWATLLQSV